MRSTADATRESSSAVDRTDTTGSTHAATRATPANLTTIRTFWAPGLRVLTRVDRARTVHIELSIAPFPFFGFG
jgi:hypothetical protein